MSPTLSLSKTSVNLSIDQLSHQQAVVDATSDATDTGYRFGYDDATEGRDQAGSAYFPFGTPAWHAYNEGYKTGCTHLAVFTGVSRFYVEFPADDAAPTITMPAPLPWETIDEVNRQQIEEEILSDAEYGDWLDGLFADDEQTDPTASMGELEFLDYAVTALATGRAPKTLSFTDEMLSDFESEHIGADFCRQPYLY